MIHARGTIYDDHRCGRFCFLLPLPTGLPPSSTPASAVKSITMRSPAGGEGNPWGGQQSPPPSPSPPLALMTGRWGGSKSTPLPRTKCSKAMWGLSTDVVGAPSARMLHSCGVGPRSAGMPHVGMCVSNLSRVLKL